MHDARKVSIAILLLAVVAQAEVPPGWHMPVPGEVPLLEGRRVTVRADFDGDRRIDHAAVVVSEDGRTVALFAHVSSQGKWFKLAEGSKDHWRQEIVIAKPGKYRTACGKGYGDYACAKGEPDSLDLSAPGINLFVPENANSFYYWDRKKKLFKEILISD